MPHWALSSTDLLTPIRLKTQPTVRQIHRTAFRCAWISGSTSSATAAASCS
jgi:hypothetical protein